MAITLSPFEAIAQNNPNTLVVWAKDGSSSVFALTDKPTVSFTETNMIITSEKTEIDFPLEKMERLSYSYDAVNIHDLQSDSHHVRMSGNTIVFPSLEANSKINIYTSDGSVVLTKTIETKGDYSISIEGLKPGIYLVNVNNLSYKIVQK